jgi:hypothetical protein
MREEGWAAEEEEGHGSSPFTTRWSSPPPLSATLLHQCLQEGWAAEEDEGHGSNPFTTRWSSPPLFLPLYFISASMIQGKHSIARAMTLRWLDFGT